MNLRSDVKKRVSDVLSKEGRARYAPLAFCVAYVVLSMCSNVMSVRTVSILGLALDAGAVLYPFSFIVRDIIHKRFGRGYADASVVISFAACVFMFLSFWIASVLPADSARGGQEAFAAVLLPSGRVILGSLIAALIAELLDGAVFHRIYTKSAKPGKAAAVSNLISVPIDTLIFSLVAFTGIVTLPSLIEIIVFNIIIKYAVVFVLLPLVAESKRK